MLAYTGIPEEQNDDVSALVNFSRNIGGSFGIALMSTLVTRRAQFHQSYLAIHVTSYDSRAAAVAAGLSSFLNRAGVGAPDSLGKAYARLYQGVQAQAFTMAYIDAFWAMAAICGCMVPLVILMKRSDPARGVVLG
jgi:MFS transporter, DHA2 family, multidrug resistance protein